MKKLSTKQGRATSKPNAEPRRTVSQDPLFSFKLSAAQMHLLPALSQLHAALLELMLSAPVGVFS